VLVARPYWWGLAADGARGVSAIIDVFRTEFDMAMALAGRPTIESIDRSLVFPDG
jgi:4-hydroxymandelate oxidase